MPKRTLRVMSVMMAVAVAVSLMERNLSAQVPVMLFTPASDTAAATDAAQDPAVFRSRALVASLPALQVATMEGQAGDRNALLTLNLFDDVVLPVSFERAETNAFGYQSWVGQVTSDPSSTVTLTWKDDVLSGGVQTGQDLYRLTTRNGVTVVDQIDPGGFRPELPPVSLPEDAAGRDAAADGPIRAADGEIVDIFVYYTAAARAARGGQTQIEALITQGIADSNTAYARSAVPATIRLVGMEELVGFAESPSNMQNDLTNFRNSATAQNKRNAVAADLMHLVLGGQSNACGVAYLGPTINAAYGVTSHDCFFQYSFSHEIGHNFGSHHAPEDGALDAWQDYAYGYKNCGAGFRTVMAYACQPAPARTRILNFSNPAVAYTGVPTGTASQHNNARSHAEAFPLVQSWRAGATAAPSAPRSLQTSVVGNQLTVSWAAPASGAPIASYILQAGTSPGLANIFSGALGALTSISATVPNGTYYLRVAARNSAGIGPPTTDVAATVGPVAPGVPRSLGATVAGTLLTVSWLPPNTGGSVSGYVLEAGTGPGLANIFNGAVGAATSLSARVPPGAYYLRARAQGPGGTSAVSNEAVASVACPIPAAPVLSASRAGGSISLTWTTPGGGGVAGYTLRAGTAAGLSNLFNGPVGLTNALSAPVPNGVYFIRVSAASACGEGAASNEVTITIP